MDWKNIVHNVAPSIGDALLGDFGKNAMSFLAHQFLGNPKATDQEIKTAIEKASPDDLIHLKSLNAQFETRMRELGLEEYKAEIEDRKNARDIMKVNVWPQVCFSSLFFLGYFALVFCLLFVNLDMKAEISGMFNIIVGVMTAAIPQILQFWFGSSKGSKDKDAALTAKTTKAKR